MAAGFGFILDLFGITKAPAITSSVDGDPAYKPSAADRIVQATLGNLTWDRIDYALRAMFWGDPRWLADIYHLIPATCEYVIGVRRQVKAGVKCREYMFMESNDSERAIAFRDEATDLLMGPRSSMGDLIEAYIECVWEGGGLIQPIWNDPASPVRFPVAFQKVPMQRVRYIRATGELAFAADPLGFGGVPISAYPMGTWIPVYVDEHIPAFDKRGTYRAILTDWFRYANVAGWWVSDIEQNDTPTAFLKAGNTQDLETFKKSAKEWGNGGKLVASSVASDATLIEKRRTSLIPHQVWESGFKERISLAFLGETQTVSIQANSGSEHSTSEHAEVADEVQQEIWGGFWKAVNQHLVTPMFVLNHGLEASADAPVGCTDFDEDEDIGTFLDNATKAKALGLDLSEQQVRDVTGFVAPSGPDDVMGATEPMAPQPAPPEPMPGPGPQPMPMEDAA